VKTQEQVAVIGEFPLGAWDDVSMREGLWASMRDKAADIAARDGKVLTDTPETRSGVMYMRLVSAGGDGGLADVETDREHAEFVKLRLLCWASADETGAEG
jgi:hypothetical protein